MIEANATSPAATEEDRMSRAGDVIENPTTGERISSIKTARDTNGELLRFEYLVLPHIPGPPFHIHPFQEERFVEVLSGTLVGSLGEDERSVVVGKGIAGTGSAVLVGSIGRGRIGYRKAR